MKKLLSLLATASLVAAFVSCNDDGEVKPDQPVDNTVVTGVITQDQTWTANKVYELDGRVIVADGVTLTIEAGTIMKGREGQGANASALMIARGGKLNAVGTVQKPIIFTSVLDNIQPGETAGTNLSENDKGKWGGLVVLGKAPISLSRVRWRRRSKEFRQKSPWDCTEVALRMIIPGRYSLSLFVTVERSFRVAMKSMDSRWEVLEAGL